MKSVKLNFIFSIIKGVMSVLFPIISFPYVARVIGPNGVGKVEYSTSVIAYFAMFAALGISLYSVREGSKVRDNRKELSKFAREILTINMLSTVVVYVLLIAVLLFSSVFSGYTQLMIVCSLTIICTTLSIEWLYQIVEDYAYISIRSIIFQIIALILLFVFVKGKDDYLIYAVITVFSTGGACLLNLFHAKKYVDLTTKEPMDLKKHIKPIMIIFGIGMASSIYLNMNKIMIKEMYGETELGLYSAAVKINSIVKTLISSISLVVLPRLSYYLSKGKIKEYLRLLHNGINLNLVISIPCAIGLIVLGKDIILLFSGEQYVSAISASNILAINMIFSAIDGLLYYQVLIPHGKDMQACIGTVIGAVINLILNTILIPILSIDGAAIATLIAEMLVFIFFMYTLRNTFSIKRMFKETYKYFVASIPIFIIGYFVSQYQLHMFLRVIIVVGSSFVFYGLLLWVQKSSILLYFLEDIKRIIKKIIKQ